MESFKFPFSASCGDKIFLSVKRGIPDEKILSPQDAIKKCPLRITIYYVIWLGLCSEVRKFFGTDERRGGAY